MGEIGNLNRVSSSLTFALEMEEERTLDIYDTQTLFLSVVSSLPSFFYFPYRLKSPCWHCAD